MPRLLEMQAISKSFPGVQALSRVDLALDKGQVHALVGKNGAGKSTLIKVLGGVIRPDSGRLSIDGTKVEFSSPHAAITRGVAIVHQELSLIPQLNVAENVFLGRVGSNGSWLMRRRPLEQATRTVLQRLASSIDPRATVGELSIAQQQIVEIAKALSRNPRILVLDEPTSALADGDADKLLTILRGLAGQGVGIIYISHRLAEVERIADRLTVLRDGASVAEVAMTEVDRGRIVELMLGEALSHSEDLQPKPLRSDSVVLRVRDISRAGVVDKVSFDLHQGEILGLAGLVGAGRTELVRLIFGCDRADAGSVEFRGRAIRRPTPRRMCRAGMGFLPEDRKHQGLVLDRSVRENMVLTILERISRLSFVSPRRERNVVNRLIAELHVACSSAAVPVATLSGGNQQKIVIGKWLATAPRVLILDEPTRGVDVQAKAQIFQILERLAEAGVAILFISSELEEVMLVSHRILTMARGRIVDERQTSQAELAEILLSATA